jgi:hypothetical protein
VRKTTPFPEGKGRGWGLVSPQGLLYGDVSENGNWIPSEEDKNGFHKQQEI